MSEEAVDIVPTVPTTSRDGGGTLVHVFLNNTTLAENEGLRKSIETDIRENYRVKVHRHKYGGPEESKKCDCVILGTGDKVSDKNTIVVPERVEQM